MTSNLEQLAAQAMQLAMAGRYGEAEALFRTYAKAQPRDPRGHFNLGKAIRDQGRADEALACFRRAVRLDPQMGEAHHNIGNILFEQRDRALAAESYRRALRINPGNTLARAHLVRARAQLCDWSGKDEEEARLLAEFRAKPVHIPPLMLLDLSSTPEDQLLAARRRVATMRLAAALPPVRSGRPLRIGYLSQDLRRHAVGFCLPTVIAAHDRDRVQVTAYANGGADGSAIRARLESSFDRFVAIEGLSDAAAAARMRHDGIDVLVDLGGFTMGARSGILAHRPAPVQLQWLGYPATMGEGLVDGILGDAHVTPAADQVVFGETLLPLPHCFMPNNGTMVTAAPPPRAELGLPEDAVVLCALHNTYKIRPDTFTLWMRLLRDQPQAVLWLLDDNAVATANLRREATRLGVDKRRLVFARRAADYDAYLARLGAADLMLDTWPYNAHSSACDALRAGLPVLTLRGATFAGRVAGSLLSAAGLSQLITTSVGDYEALAQALIADRTRLSALRAELRAGLAGSPLLDMARLARDLEDVYTDRVERLVQQTG